MAVRRWQSEKPDRRAPRDLDLESLAFALKKRQYPHKIATLRGIITCDF